MRFETDYPGAVAAFKGEALRTLDDGHARFRHVLGQLDDAQVWHRPHPGMNAVGNLVLHVCGSLTQWIAVGCDPARDRSGSAGDGRDRPAAFAAAGGETCAALAVRLASAVTGAADVMQRLNKDHLLEPRTIQGVGVTGMGAVWHGVAHLQAHAQEAVYATRLIRGDLYDTRGASGVDGPGVSPDAG